MKEWFTGLESRERMMVVAGAVVLALLFFYAFIVSPAVSAYQKRSADVQSQRDTLTWMQQAAAQINQLRGSGTQGNGLGGQSLLALVDRSARESGLGTALKRVKPDGALSVRVWFEGVAFDDLVLWLGGLESSYQVRVQLITLERLAQSGRVQAQLTLEAPG